jgi:hypothetical protein
VDWRHLGNLSEGNSERKLWGFTMTLGSSRRMMACSALDQKLSTLGCELRLRLSLRY